MDLAIKGGGGMKNSYNWAKILSGLNGIIANKMGKRKKFIWDWGNRYPR
jgi:hypothetical protein